MLFKELNSFYRIRGDGYARDYLEEFVRTVVAEDVKIPDLKMWVRYKRSHVCFEFPVGVERNYVRVLFQFVRYLSVLYESSQVSGVRSVRSRRCTRIYDTFYDLQKSSGSRID